MLEVTALAELPEIVPGDDLVALILERWAPADGDVLVVAQKVVSKVEDRFVDPADVTPGERALELAAATDKDPVLVQVVLDETRNVLRAAPGVLITETVHGMICANAGVDASNVPGERLLLLPRDPDGSARVLRAELARRGGCRVGVVISDSFGRAWRHGQLDVAIGCAGIDPLLDARGERDREGRELNAAVQAVADELAAAADLARSKASGEPVVVVRGRADLVTEEDGPGVSVSLRDAAEDLFR